MPDSSPDPLAGLFVNARAIDRARLAEGLQGLIGIDEETSRILPLRDFNHLDAKRKLLAYLLGTKALDLLQQSGSTKTKPRDIEAAIGIPGGTIRRNLAELADSRMVSKDGAGAYNIADYQIIGALDYLEAARSSK